jgi:hypothetical protein
MGDNKKEDVGGEQRSWDLFISHASEDKESFIRPLAHALQNLGVWYGWDPTVTIGKPLYIPTNSPYFENRHPEFARSVYPPCTPLRQFERFWRFWRYVK